MRKKIIPGKRSNIALLLTSSWTLVSLFVVIVGHLVIAFYAYGVFTGYDDALLDLQSFLPMLSLTWLYLLAGAAVVIDIWMLISQKKAFDKQFER